MSSNGAVSTLPREKNSCSIKPKQSSHRLRGDISKKSVVLSLPRRSTPLTRASIGSRGGQQKQTELSQDKITTKRYIFNSYDSRYILVYRRMCIYYFYSTTAPLVSGIESAYGQKLPFIPAMVI